MYTIVDTEQTAEHEIRKREDLEAVSTSALLETYNELTGKSTKKFASRAKGEEQVWKLIEEVDEAPETAPSTGTVGNTIPLPKSAIIRLVAQENPKRPNTKAYATWERYVDGKTVFEHNITIGIELSDIRWNIEKGFIRLEDPSDES